MSRTVIVVRGWVAQLKLMKFPCSLKLYLNEIWTLDFVAPFNPPSNQKIYILVCTDYVTKWVEAVSLSKATKEEVINFLFELFVQYGFPREIIIDGGSQFTTHKISATMQKYHIKNRVTSPYHPQSNG